jgi:S-DNA-T family DNA segregation ATPase FtsK/SpoIIIE
MFNYFYRLKKNFVFLLCWQTISLLSALVLGYGIVTFKLQHSCFYYAKNSQHSFFYNIITYIYYYFGIGAALVPILFIALAFFNLANFVYLSGIMLMIMVLATLQKFTLVGGWNNGGGLLGARITKIVLGYLDVNVLYYLLFFCSVILFCLLDKYGYTFVYHILKKTKKLNLLSRYLTILQNVTILLTIKFLYFLKLGSLNILRLLVKGEAEILEMVEAEEYQIFDKDMFQFLPMDKTVPNIEVDQNLEPKIIGQVENTNTYDLPNTNLLSATVSKNHNEPDLGENIINKLKLFNVTVRCVDVRRGPVVTTYVLEPDANVKLSRIMNLIDDISLALEVSAVRIIAPIIGTCYIGLEVPNKARQTVFFKSIIDDAIFKNFKGILPLVLGYNTEGKAVVEDLAKLPHLLVAGSTGAGKSVAVNSMIMGLLYHKKPQDVKLILIDPKRLELAPYNDIPHLLFPVATEPSKALFVLKWLLSEMERRYTLMAEQGVRNIQENNNLNLPYIVAIIDEFADLIMTSGKDLEHCVVRLAQMARASGIHLIIATQRPSVDVITGLIKANFPSRIAFRVSSKIDSRTIIDDSGAESLLGNGDMLFLCNKGLSRFHGSFVSDEEVNKVALYVKNQGKPEYQFNFVSDEHDEFLAATSLTEDTDELYTEIVEYVLAQKEVSISLLQRRFRIGYNRSARIVDQLEKDGYLVSADGGKTRKVVQQ